MNANDYRFLYTFACFCSDLRKLCFPPIGSEAFISPNLDTVEAKKMVAYAVEHDSYLHLTDFSVGKMEEWLHLWCSTENDSQDLGQEAHEWVARWAFAVCAPFVPYLDASIVLTGWGFHSSEEEVLYVFLSLPEEADGYSQSTLVTNRPEDWQAFLRDPVGFLTSGKPKPVFFGPDGQINL